MKIIKLLTSILGILFLIILTLIIIDLRPHFDLITSDETIPEPYQSPSEKTINLRSDIVFLSASEMASKIRDGSLSSVEVVKAHLRQIYKFNQSDKKKCLSIFKSNNYLGLIVLLNIFIGKI